MRRNDVKSFLKVVLSVTVLLVVTGGCSLDGGCENPNSTYKMNQTIPNRAFDMPRISNKGTTLFVTIEGLSLKGYVTKKDNTTTTFTLPASINMKFAWMVTPGDANGNGALGCIVCAVPTGVNSFTMKYAIFDIEGSMPTGLSTISGGDQSGVTNIVLATNRENSVVAAWDVAYTSNGNPISRFAILNLQGLLYPTETVLDLVYPDTLFNPQTIDGSTPPRIALDNNNILCAVQGGKVGVAYATKMVGVLKDLVNGSATDPNPGAYTPANSSAAVTVKSCSSGFYMLASTHLATEASQVQNTDEYLVFEINNLTFPTTLSTVETVKVFQDGVNTAFTMINQVTNSPVVTADLVETTVTNSANNPTSGIFISTIPNSNVSQLNTLKVIQSDTASQFIPKTLRLVTSPSYVSNVTVIGISSTQNFSNWIAALTSASPARVQVYNLVTGQLVLDQEVTTSSIANSIVEVNPQGDVVVVYEDTNGNVFSEVFEVGENPYSKLQQSLKQFSPFKLLPGMR